MVDDVWSVDRSPGFIWLLKHIIKQLKMILVTFLLLLCHVNSCCSCLGDVGEMLRAGNVVGMTTNGQVSHHMTSQEM